MNPPTVSLPISTSEGEFLAHYSQRGLAELNFPDRKTAARAAKPDGEISAKIREWHRTTESALKKLLAGEKQAKFPPLDLAGTAFQKSVWRAMLKIASGKTKSYGEIAEAIGKPGAVRAVGGACGANPIPVFVPCHRVLAANKKIGGFSSGLHWKWRLLDREGVIPKE
ncbi:MAG TPA: methylated-DNA--[protein]-cysteine S-methyltransferase [Verrucomicrobiae bacterium]|jgi:O-6-methylguanine DNA methyltransferase|nr:methylated-DNA--[protein]-cysteine S-methyltransferase [Verrucomicrobiae bacterium]